MSLYEHKLIQCLALLKALDMQEAGITDLAATMHYAEAYTSIKEDGKRMTVAKLASGRFVEDGYVSCVILSMKNPAKISSEPTAKKPRTYSRLILLRQVMCYCFLRLCTV